MAEIVYLSNGILQKGQYMQHSVTVRMVSVLGIALLLNSMGVIVSAADIDASNNQTGPDSHSSNEISESNNTDVSVKNTSEIKNDVKLNLNTGGITIKKNTEVDGVKTGDITVGLKVANEANTASPSDSKSLTGNDSDVSFSNNKTGHNSESKNEVNLENNNSFSLTNKADINNNINVKLNTGEIDIEKNTKVGLIRTGDIKVFLDLNTKVNSKDVAKSADRCVTDCNKKEVPTPTPNITPTPEMGNGGGEIPGVGIVPAGANMFPFILLGLTFLLILARPKSLGEVI